MPSKFATKYVDTMRESVPPDIASASIAALETADVQRQLVSEAGNLLIEAIQNIEYAMVYAAVMEGKEAYLLMAQSAIGLTAAVGSMTEATLLRHHVGEGQEDWLRRTREATKIRTAQLREALGDFPHTALRGAKQSRGE